MISSIYNRFFSTTISSSKPLNDLVNNKYKVIASNVNRLEEAEVVCLGENHTSQQNRMDNGKIIDELSNQDDLVLTEFDENLSQELEAEWGKNHEKPDLFKLFAEDKKLSKTECCGKFFTRMFLSKFKTKEELKKDQIDARTQQAQFVTKPLAIKGWDKRGKSWWDMASSLFTALHLTNPEQLMKTLPSRNQNLCKTIDENKKEHRKIFVLAGSAHLTPSSVYGYIQRLIRWWIGFTPWHQDKAYSETLESLKAKRFVILVPRDISNL